MSFLQKLETAIQKNNSLLCVGLDPDFDKLPNSLKSKHNPLFEFNKEIIESTQDLVCAFKPQIAGYSALGAQGLEILEQTIHYLKTNYPDIPLILDAKRADIGSTSEKYAQEAFDVFEADAVTVNPYLGKDALLPFLQRREKGVIVLCRTSNKGAADFQSLDTNGEPLYIKVARAVAEWHEEFGNCLLVVGATWPEEMKKIREITKNMFFLVPGIGAQGGDLPATVNSGLREDKSGLIIHSSRAILYASSGSDFATRAKEEATKLREKINKYRHEPY
ncbi:MAG: orotidine-5'-phosphate decarboxylase [Candidatus Levybacteria bacterium]|nr:orotidine-5'-phosphate decarboxylase [Candidatus Levybacteria bacterium]